MSTRFDSSSIILTGGGCRREVSGILSGLDVRRPLLVTDPFFKATEFVAEIQASLERAGISGELFSDFQPDPTDQNVKLGVERFRAAGADSILAIGGGSALDVAKIIGVASTNREQLSEFQGYQRIPKAGPPLVAMPTTAGTGSEATKVAVITDTVRNVKMMILDSKLTPTAAVVDYEMTLSMPNMSMRTIRKRNS